MLLIVEGIMGRIRHAVHRYAKGNNTDDGCVNKKAKDTKKYVIKQEIIFEDYKEGLKNNKTILKFQQRFRSKAHDVFTEEDNKIALSANDDKRIQAPDGVSHIHMVQEKIEYND